MGRTEARPALDLRTARTPERVFKKWAIVKRLIEPRLYRTIEAEGKMLESANPARRSLEIARKRANPAKKWRRRETPNRTCWPNNLAMRLF